MTFQSNYIDNYNCINNLIQVGNATQLQNCIGHDKHLTQLHNLLELQPVSNGIVYRKG